MALADKMTALHSELTQREQTRDARAILQNVRSTIEQANVQLQTIADSGSFDTVDVEVKQVLVAAWNVCKNAQTGFAVAEVKTLLDWSP